MSSFLISIGNCQEELKDIFSKIKNKKQLANEFPKEQEISREQQFKILDKIRNSINPVIFLQFQNNENNTLLYLTQFYAAYNCLERKIDFDENIMVKAGSRLDENGIKKVILSKKEDTTICIPIFAFLKRLTYQYNAKDIDEIKNWYKKEGENKPRIEWAIARVNKILNTPPLSKKGKYEIAKITRYFPIEMMDDKEVKQWWQNSITKHAKNQLFKLWSKEALFWGIENCNNPDKKMQGYAYVCINSLMDRDVLVKMGLIQARNEMFSRFDIMKWQDKLKAWFNKNKDTIDPRNNVINDHCCNF